MADKGRGTEQGWSEEGGAEEVYREEPKVEGTLKDDGGMRRWKQTDRRGSGTSMEGGSEMETIAYRSDFSPAPARCVASASPSAGHSDTLSADT